MSPPARPGTPAPRGGPARPAPPRPAPPRPAPPRPAPPRPRPRPASETDGTADPADPSPATGTAPTGTPATGTAPTAPTGTAEAATAPTAETPRPTRDPAAAPGTDRTTGPVPAAPPHDVVPASVASDAVTTYTARRRALGIPVRPAVVSSGSAARFAERVAMRRRLARHKAYLAAAGLTLVGALAWLLLLSPVLALHATEVEVTGAGTVVDVADVHAVVAGVDGVPLPRLDTVGLRDRVLEVPGVRQAKVSRIWPHGLVVALVSREPAAAVPQRAPSSGPGTPRRADDGPGGPDGAGGAQGAGYTLLDIEGFSVGWTPTPPEGLPVVDVPLVPEGRNRSLDAVLAILEALPPELAAEVATIEAPTRDTVRMGLRDGRSVVWGSASDAPLKIRVLQTLRAAPAAADAQEFDVSAPTLPITR